MRKGQDRKVNNRELGFGSVPVGSFAGRAGCLGLLALGLALVNPMSCLSAFAEGEDDSDEANYDNQVMTTSETPSTVNIAFLPTAASGSVTPVNAGGDKAKVDVKATVRVQNSGGYSVYLGSSSSQLTNGANVIDPVEAAVTYANLPVNSWGYAFIKNGGASNDNTTYNAMPATLRSTALDANTSTNITDETRTYTLSFAANIGNDKPAGTYKNSVTMSVVSSPLVVAEEFAYDFGGITTMQAMTTAICNAAPTGGVKQLQDTRDGKYYWIGKMKDGKCWMTQNLDLDLDEKTLPLKAETSDVSVDWTPMNGEVPVYTANIVNATTIQNNNVGQRSWSLGDYSIMNPTSAVSCGKLETAEACAGSDTKDRLKYYATPTTANGDTNAHYILGNFYQWNAVTAGTGGTITEGQAESSICPKGWKLPESNTDAAGSFDGLIKAYLPSSSVIGLVSAPLYFVRGGYVSQYTANQYYNAGNYGHYWASTPDSNGVSAYYLTFSGVANSINPDASIYRYHGYSVRCIAR